MKSDSLPGGRLIHGDALDVLPTLPAACAQVVIADPPYFQVLKRQKWDNAWKTADEYMEWTCRWVEACRRVLHPEGLLFVFGQPGKREHVWLHICSLLSRIMQFHDLLVWDRVVGYNERSDSFTPQYEMILVLRQSDGSRPYFNKDAARIPYDDSTIQTYLKDKRYKDAAKRREHLLKGKYMTNILRVPSLKGRSREKLGHPSQKPLALIEILLSVSTRPGDTVLDPFLGSGTTAEAALRLNRKWIGIENNPTYTTITRKRLTNTTGLISGAEGKSGGRQKGRPSGT